MDKEIVFNGSPFLQRADCVESPVTYLPDHWVTKEFGFRAFNSGNKADVWVYFEIDISLCIQATPEFLDDTILARAAFTNIKNNL